MVADATRRSPMVDTFEETPLVPGTEVLIRAPGDSNVIGVVLSVDEAARAVTFVDGRTYVSPPLEEVEP